MKKILSLSTVLIPLIITNGAIAATHENKIFVGASANAVSVDSTFKDEVDGTEYVNIGGDETSIGGSINAGYKMYFAENGNNSFFITPEISWNFTSVEKKNTFSTGYNSYEVKPMFAFDLAFGYEFSQKHSVFVGLGAQYTKYDYEERFTGYTPYSKDGSKIGGRTFIGYEYNLTKAISFNTKLAYSYIEPNIGYDVKAETSIVDLGLGVKYNF